jgi:predicted DNA-binding WGR domain protein
MLLSWSKDNRFYNVQLQANLFGGISVFCSWGSIDTKRGSCKIIYCDNELDAENALQVIKKRRKTKGYRLNEIYKRV